MPHRNPSFRCALPAIVLAATALAGCASRASRDADPRIDTRTVVDSRGIPNGRSDDDVPSFAGQPIPVSTDPGFGYSADKAIRLGPSGSGDDLRYLASLRGPSGEPVAYAREGACCRFEDAALPFGGGMIDVYAVTPDGARRPLRLYIDMYRLGPLLLPQGFTLRETENDP
jgi:hypothetical protein